MKKTASHLLLIFLALAPFFPPAANADSNVAHVKPTHSSAKSENAYIKHQRKLTKKEAKQQKQSVKKWRKQHDVTH